MQGSILTQMAENGLLILKRCKQAMTEGDFYCSEKGHMSRQSMSVKIELVRRTMERATSLKSGLKLLPGEIIDASTLSLSA